MTAPEPQYTRPPTLEERQAAVRLSRMLDTARHIEPTRTTIKSEMPPGRIDFRERQIKKYQQARKVPVTAKQYRQIKTAIAPSPRQTVGIACDMSGSMRYAQEALGVSRWMLTDALNRVNGSVASVLFGEEAYPIQGPQDRLREIEVYRAYDAYENYTDAFSLLDQRLNIIDGTGARLLVFFTDGHFNLADAVQYAEVTMNMCRQVGVGVLWMNVNGYFARADAYGHGTVVNTMGTMSPLEIAGVIGEAVIAEYKNAALRAA